LEENNQIPKDKFMKKNVNQGFFAKRRLYKIFIAMKLAFILSLVCSLQLSASVYSQNTRLNLKVNKLSLVEVLKEIRNNSEFSFVYDLEDVEYVQSVSLNTKDASVEEILEVCFENTNLTYDIVDKVVVIMQKPDEAPANKEVQKKKEFKGTVTDKDGNTLPGVSVVVKGSFLGTTTDGNGKYKIVVPAKAEVLVYSFVGMISKEITLGDRTEINVTLQSIAAKLMEVVITGYGQIEKRKLSSSVVTVHAKDLNEGGVVSLDQMLEGKITGLAVMGNTSTPGAATKIRIRGSSSITGNREPVWVVDGVIIEDPVPISTQDLNDLDNVNLIGNAISFIDPEDISRIDVLKDASATAIYGVKAANGVIVVTTKKGRIGKPKIRYSTSYSWQTRPSYSKLHLMNSKERVEVSEEIYNRGLLYKTEPADIGYEGALYDLFNLNINESQFDSRIQKLKEQNTDWFDILFDTALTQKHSVSISGANDKTNYYFSGGFSDSKASISGTGMKKYNALMKMSYNINKKLRLSLQLRGAFNDKEYLNSSIDAYSYAYNTSRAIPFEKSNGEFEFYNRGVSNDGFYKYNIQNEINNSGRTIKNGNINLNANVSYKITSNLTYNGLVSINRTNTNEEEWFNDKTYKSDKLRGCSKDVFDPLQDYYSENSELPFGGELKNRNNNSTAYTIRNNISYKKYFNEKHEITSTIGTETRSNTYTGLQTVERGYLPERGKGFVSIDPTKFTKYHAWLKRNTNIITDRTTNVLSYYATATYSYDNRYSINGNFRADGSNKFGQDDDNKFLPVWSGSFRWNLHNENFLINSDIVNLFAFRFSYGVQGNVSPDQTPNLIIKQNPLDQTSQMYSSYISRLPNPNLIWEKTISQNIAVDYAFLKNRISGSFEMYKKEGKDQIIRKEVSSVTGSKTVSINDGTLENSGVEFSIRGKVIDTKDFDWTLSFNAYQNKNKVTKSGSKSQYKFNDYINGSLVRNGESLNGFYSYKFDKLDENGLPTFKDQEETDGITQEDMYNQIFAYSGKRVADVNGGFGSKIRYKAFTLNLLFSFSKGKKVRLNNLYDNLGQKLPLPQQNMSDEFTKRWRSPGDENLTNIPALSDQSLALNYFGSGEREIEIGDNRWYMYNKSDLRVVSADYIRLRNVSLKYRLPKHICKKINLHGANFRLEARNLFVITNKKLKGQDPDQIGFGKGIVPVTPSYTFGFDVTF
jgi:TonB-linked SusC/RagA family outer membrane protein